MEHIEIDYSDLEYQEYCYFQSIREMEEIYDILDESIDLLNIWEDDTILIEIEKNGFETVLCEEKTIISIQGLEKLACIQFKNFKNKNSYHERQ